MKPSKDHSVFSEPHLQAPQKHGDIDPIVDPPAGFNVPAPVFSNQSMDHVDYSVYDEPGVAGMIGKAEPHALTYANWLTANMAGWSQSKAWAVTLIVSMLSGPWAILALCISFFEFGNYQSTGYYRAFDFLMVCAFIPLAQEIAKIALPLWVVEKRPFYFTGWFQIFFCSLASATVFVTIYNLFGQFFFPPRTVFGLLFFLDGIPVDAFGLRDTIGNRFGKDLACNHVDSSSTPHGTGISLVHGSVSCSRRLRHRVLSVSNLRWRIMIASSSQNFSSS